MMHVYLAGPDVFLPDPAARFREMKRICARHGLHGVSPLDPLTDGDPPEWKALPEALRIARRNETHIARCDAMIANLTPFRGPSADAGTVFEIGFMRALGHPIHGWTNDSRAFAMRSRLFAGFPADAILTLDANDMLIEDFALPDGVMVDNLMIANAIAASGGHLTSADPAERWTDLAAFEACAARVTA